MRLLAERKRDEESERVEHEQQQQRQRDIKDTHLVKELNPGRRSDGGMRKVGPRKDES